MAKHQSIVNSDPPESLGDADLLTTLLAAAKVKQPRATANALLNGTSRGRASSTNVP